MAKSYNEVQLKKALLVSGYIREFDNNQNISHIDISKLITNYVIQMSIICLSFEDVYRRVAPFTSAGWEKEPIKDPEQQLGLISCFLKRKSMAERDFIFLPKAPLPLEGYGVQEKHIKITIKFSYAPNTLIDLIKKTQSELKPEDKFIEINEKTQSFIVKSIDPSNNNYCGADIRHQNEKKWSHKVFPKDKKMQLILSFSYQSKTLLKSIIDVLKEYTIIFNDNMMVKSLGELIDDNYRDTNKLYLEVDLNPIALNTIELSGNNQPSEDITDSQ
ncbi:MAG: hypothetical protein HRU35_07905 [Rickettsiaceae bacterium]|nr:hypothetical protein [Rickettsiaceae bacterium]